MSVIKLKRAVKSKYPVTFDLVRLDAPEPCKVSMKRCVCITAPRSIEVNCTVSTNSNVAASRV